MKDKSIIEQRFKFASSQPIRKMPARATPKALIIDNGAAYKVCSFGYDQSSELSVGKVVRAIGHPVKKESKNV